MPEEPRISSLIYEKWIKDKLSNRESERILSTFHKWAIKYKYFVYITNLASYATTKSDWNSNTFIFVRDRHKNYYFMDTR